MWWPVVLFCVFTLLSMAGAYWVAAHWRGRVAGIWAAIATALFFVALAFGVWALMREGGMA
jgi:hypothetical protein